MKKLTVASALIMGLVLSACGGGGGGDGAAPQASNGGATVQNNGAGANPGNGASGSNSSNSTSAGTGTSGKGGTSGSSGSGGSNSGNSGNSGSASNSGSGSSSSGSNSGGTNGGASGSGSGGSGTSDSGSGASGSTDSGSGSNTGGGASADLGNTVPVVVSAASKVVNFPLVSVTICQPNSGAQQQCATIDRVLLDTGSFGLRLYASAIPSATLAALPISTDAASGNNIASCALFASGNMWGSVRTADVKLSREVAVATPIQVMSDPAVVSAKPQACEFNTSFSTSNSLGANGILGVGPARNDCGAACASGPVDGFYYADANPAVGIAVPRAQQVVNPVALFPVDNNGVVLAMPTVPASGALTATGTLTFGIDTQTNNALSGAGATVLATDSWGDFSASYNGTSSVLAFIDSGSNSTNFEDQTISQWQGFYAPITTWTRNIVMTDLKGATGTVSIDIANASSLLATRFTAFSNLTAPMAQTVDLGLPFFYGRRVYYGIEGKPSAGGGTGPYVAYMNSPATP